MRDFSLDKLDPTQRVFADRVLAWGKELVSAYKHNATVRDRKKLKRVPVLRSYLGGSAGSGKSTTLRTILQHLRLASLPSTLGSVPKPHGLLSAFSRMPLSRRS